jgi:hypothetical protein
MKKIFSKLENKNEEKLPSGNFTNFTGKQFQINKHTVVVEEILAEGTYRQQIQKLDICSKFFLSLFYEIISNEIISYWLRLRLLS